jgi:hypothetical protein
MKALCASWKRAALSTRSTNSEGSDATDRQLGMSPAKAQRPQRKKHLLKTRALQILQVHKPLREW